jgi:PTH2 family peptidyl-tRNA hydrolase
VSTFQINNIKEHTQMIQGIYKDTSSMLYFLAGALLPSIAFFFKSKSDAKKIEQMTFELQDEYDSEEDEFEDVTPSSKIEVSSKWGMRDGPYKMILCVNQELGMGKGKIAAQCCHAAVGCYKKAKKNCPSGLSAWEYTGCAKIAVKCPTEEEMNEILMKAIQIGIPYYLVEDAGRTQIAAGSRTVLGLGPAPDRVFEGITSHLKLM